MLTPMQSVGPIHIVPIMCFFNFFLHHDVRMYDFYGPIVPEINYPIL